MGRLRGLKTALTFSAILLFAVQYAGGCGGGAQADMVFIVDASGSVGSSNFQTVLVFVRDLIDAFDIGSDKIRVGVLKYDHNTYTEFNLNTYYDKTAMKNRVTGIHYTSGGTNTAQALAYARTNMFTAGNGDRANVPNIAIVITDGVSYPYPGAEALNLRNTGATVFSVGVGSGIPLTELNEIATDPDSDHVFAVSGFSSLTSIISTFQTQACPSPCAGGAQVDVVFILDASGSVGSTNFQTMLQFVRDLVDTFDIASNKIRVGVQKYSSGTNTEFNLNTYYDKNAMKTRIMQIVFTGGSTNTGGALSYSRTNMFTSGNGDRTGVVNVLVVLSDGISNNGVDTANQARACRDTGMRIFSVGIGSGIPMSELNEMATDPDSEHVFAVSNFGALQGIKTSFGNKACGPTNGGWGAWGNYGSCSKNCGGGSKTRTRSCNSPPPSNGGSQCPGSSSETAACNTHACAVNGNWGNWGNWGGCSKTCATGSKTRTRLCNNPSPAHGGNPCSGSGSESTSCNTHACPINGGWSAWGAYGSCTTTCGGGIKTRTRACNNPSPQHGGAQCSGSSSDTASCNTHGCPVNGAWSAWSAWGTCSTTCELGSWSRSRTCTNPAPLHGGLNCPGSATSTSSCNLRPCPIDGAWSGWQAWGACSVTCMGVGVRSRIRDCDNPTPQHGGAQCPGPGTNSETCDKRLTLCSAGNGWAVQVYSTTPGTPVNGGFGPWSSWSPCSHTCGAGLRLRVRKCNSPVPKFGGVECSGDYTEKELCGNTPCPNSKGYVQTCPERYFDCHSGNITCVHYLKKCDCVADCDDSSDEDPEWAGCIADNTVCNNRALLVSPGSLLMALLLAVATFLPAVWRFLAS